MDSVDRGSQPDAVSILSVQTGFGQVFGNRPKALGQAVQTDLDSPLCLTKHYNQSRTNTYDMQQISIRLPPELIESLEQEADERDKSRAQHIRDVLKDRDNTDDDERVTELQDELEQVRRERDKALGRIEQMQDEIADLRQFRDNAVGSLASAPAVGELTEEGEVVVEEEEGDGRGWWPF